MTIHNLAFNAEIRAIYDSNGRMIPSDLGRGVYRNDTDELIAIAGPNFKPVDHMQVVGPVLQSLEKQGYTIEERSSATRADFYDLMGKKGAFVNAQVSNNGAVMRTDIILGDFIQPTGSSAYLPKGEDTMFYRISLLNSHDGSLAVHANTSYLRLVCANGMVDARWKAATRAKHTSGLNVDALKAKIANGMHMMGGDAERFGLYARTRVTLEQAKRFFELTIAKLADKPSGEAHFSAPLVEQLLGNFTREDQTVWGLWNAMTAWATHGDVRSNANRLTTRLGRESRVATAMRSAHWDGLLAA